MKNLRILVFALATIAGSASAFAQTFYIAQKSEQDYQSSNTASSTPYDYYFKAVESSYTYNGVSGPPGSFSVSSTPDQGGDYKYKSSTYTTLTAFNTAFADSTNGTSSTYYNFTENGTIELSAPIYGDVYPNQPLLTDVNGNPPGSSGTPSWNASGDLVLNPTINNTLTWSAFTTTNGNNDYSNAGSINFKITDTSNNIIESQLAIGPASQAAFNSYVLDANTLTAGDTYDVTISYFLADTGTGTGTSTDPLEAVGYDTDDLFTIYAVPEPFTPGLLLFGGAVLFIGLRRFCPGKFARA